MSLGTYKLPMRHPHNGVGAFFMSIIRQALKKHNPKADPLGGEMSQRDREGRLALKLRLPHNQRTYPSDCKAGAREKAVPLGGRGTAPAVEGGNSLTNIDCPPTSPPSPNGPTSHPKGEAKLLTAKQEPEMSRPPWGKVAGVSLTEGGNSLSNLDCPTTNAPTPTTAVQKNSTKSEGPYTPASELPPTEP